MLPQNRDDLLLRDPDPLHRSVPPAALKDFLSAVSDGGGISTTGARSAAGVPPGFAGAYSGLTEAMGGRVWYEQVRGGGADFRLSLPVPRAR